MEISERARLTYEALQKRKRKRERQQRQDAEAISSRSYWRNFNIKYRQYYSLGHKK